MKGKTHHLDRKFIRLYTFSIAWAFFGAAAPALLRGITWLGILLAVYGLLLTLLGRPPPSPFPLSPPTHSSAAPSPLDGAPRRSCYNGGSPAHPPGAHDETRHRPPCARKPCLRLCPRIIAPSDNGPAPPHA